MTYSSNKKPAGLSSLSSLETNDTIIIGDTSDTSEVVKVITYENLLTQLETDINSTSGAFIFTVAVSDETTALTTGTAKITFRMPAAVTLTSVRATVNTAPTGSSLVVDINEGGATILSTKLSIDATEKTSTTAAVPVVISDATLADDAEVTIDIDQVGSTIAGAGLKVTLIGNYV